MIPLRGTANRSSFCFLLRGHLSYAVDQRHYVTADGPRCYANELKIPLDGEAEPAAAAKALKCPPRSSNCYGHKKSGRCGQGNIFVCNASDNQRGRRTVLKRRLHRGSGAEPFECSPPRLNATACSGAIAGFGPGEFAALTLAQAGLRPIVLERGKDADTRRAALAHGQKGLTKTNVQFGEGGGERFRTAS